MGKLDRPGYPLPSGELGEDEIVCQLVYLPDRPEYWQAFLGAYHYLTTWRAWERDEDKRGKDAAANWREAFELTIGCWRMTCLEQLQEDVSNILAQLRNADPCCSENVTYYDSTTYITIIVPGEGDPPDTYGETEVEDWDEWLEYLCHNAHLWVDELIRAAETVAVALSTGGLTIGLLAAVITAVAFFVVGGVLALPLLMVVLFGLTTGVSSSIFSAAAEDIEDAREDIVCAIILGSDVASEVENAISSTAWDLLFNYIDIDSAIALLYEGGDGETYLEAELDDSCVCVAPPGTPEGYHHEYPQQFDQWVTHGNMTNNVRTYSTLTGIATWSFTTGGGNQFEGTLHWLDTVSYQHGGYIEVLEYTGPSDAHQLGSPGTVGYDDGVGLPQTTGGYHSGNHSGQEWDDYIAQFDNGVTYTVNNKWNMFQEIPNQTAVGASAYYLVWRTVVLMPD